jgi:hypothetical protein
VVELLNSETMMPRSVEEQLADLDAILAQGPDYTSSAIFGALVGAAAGFWAIKRRGPEERHVLKFALYGAGINMAVAYGIGKLGRKVSSYAHEHPELLIQPPTSPVVTKGAFTGAPRALYRARHPFDQQDQEQPPRSHHHHHHHPHHEHHVGGPVPLGGDYSFTRRPGFNSKSY